MGKHRILALLLIAVMACTACTGCGPGAASTSGGGGSSDSSGESAPASGEGSVKMTLLSTTLIEKPDGDVEQEMIDKYLAANPHVEMETMTVSANDIMPKITAMITANQTPDIFSVTAASTLPTLIDMKAVQPLNELFGQEFIDDLYPAVASEVVLDGTLYVVPWGAIPTGFLYRTDWLEETGLEPPTTFAELTEVAKAMTKDMDGDGTIDRYGLALIASNDSSASSRFVTMLRNCRSSELRREGDGYVTEINNEGGQALLEYFYQWANVDKVVPPGASEIDHKTAINLLATEQAGCTFSGPHTLGTVYELNPELKGKFAAVPMPTLYEGDTSISTGSINGFAISATSSCQEQAVDYLKFLTNAENFAVYNARSLRLPPRKSLAESLTGGDPNLAPFNSALENSYTTENVTYMGDVLSILAEALNSAAAGAVTDGATAAATAEEKIDKVIEKN